jgi:hypothetical protein
MDSIFIPFGEECYTCQSIDVKFSNSFRKQAYPFDYVGHTFIEKIYENIIDLHEHELKRANNTINNDFFLNSSDFNKEEFNGDFFFVHKKYGFKYWHDNVDDYNVFLEKYNRRYKKMYDAIKRDSIIFLSVNHFDNIYNKVDNNIKQLEIIKLYDFLLSFNNNIKFIAINYETTSHNRTNLHFVNLHVDNNIPFSESKQQFTSCLYKYVSSLK